MSDDTEKRIDNLLRNMALQSELYKVQGDALMLAEIKSSYLLDALRKVDNILSAGQLAASGDQERRADYLTDAANSARAAVFLAIRYCESDVTP